MKLAAVLLMCPKLCCSSKWSFTAPTEVHCRLLMMTFPSAFASTVPAELVMAAWQGSNIPAAMRNKSFICIV